jgi:ribosomal protein L7/L12
LSEIGDVSKFGRLITDATFFGTTVRLYSNGYVRVGWRSNAPYEKLLAISGSADVSKKTALGRGVAAVLTGGHNLVFSPNKRGDVYLTIVTDRKTHALHQSPPGLKDIQAMYQLVAAGESILKGVSSSAINQPQYSQPSKSNEKIEQSQLVGDLLQQLKQLGELHASGVVSDEEFSQLKEQIMSMKSSLSETSVVAVTSEPKNLNETQQEIKGDFDVILEKPPKSQNEKINVIKEFRLLQPGISLSKAKSAVDNPPVAIARRISYSVALEVASRLESLGGMVRIESSVTDNEISIPPGQSEGVSDSGLVVNYVPTLSKEDAQKELSKLLAARSFEKYNGQNGVVNVLDGVIEIVRDGLIAKTLNHKLGLTSIAFESIIGIQEKVPTAFVNGYIKIHLRGDKNIFNPKMMPSDKNAIMFTYSHRKEHAELKAILEQISNIALSM